MPRPDPSPPASIPRRLVHRPVEGASVRETLLELLRDEDAARLEVRALGRVDALRLSREPRPRSGALDVITLTGVVTAALTRITFLGSDEHGALVGGPIEDARAVDLELVVELFPVEEAAPRPSTPASPGPAPKPLPSAVTPSWAEVAAASAAAAAEEDVTPDQPLPRPGDRIEHPAFGVCAVEKLEEDEEFVLVRSQQGRLLRLAVEVLRLELVREEGGVRHFKSRVRGGKTR